MKKIRTLKQLRGEEIKIRAEINKREEAESRKIQTPYLKSLVGKCFVYRDNSYGSTYPKWDVFRKIIECFENKENTLYLIFEEVQIDGMGKPSIEVDNQCAYMSRVWFKQVPFSGYVKCSDEEYQVTKEEVYKQMSSLSKMKKFLNRKF